MCEIVTDLSVDTVRAYWNKCFFKIDALIWRRIGEDVYFCKYEDLRFTYNTKSYILIVEFSLSKIANGCNAFPYEYIQYPVVQEKVEDAVKNITGRSHLLSNAVISRIDIYRSLYFKDIKKAREFIVALNRVPKSGRIKRNIYESERENGDELDGTDDEFVRSDYTSLKKGDMIKAYVKNDDPNIPIEIRENLPATVRLEVECKGKASAKQIIKSFKASDVLSCPSFWVEIYNSTLKKLGLDGVILSKSVLIKATKKILIEQNPQIRESTIKKRIEALRKIITGTKSKKPDRASSGLIAMLKKNGICPCCSDDIKTLSAKDVMPAWLQKTYEVYSSVIADKKAKIIKRRYYRFSLLNSLTTALVYIGPAYNDTS